MHVEYAYNVKATGLSLSGLVFFQSVSAPITTPAVVLGRLSCLYLAIKLGTHYLYPRAVFTGRVNGCPK